MKEYFNMEQFKVLSRFSRYLSVEAAVSDIPQKLKDAANKHWYNGFKGFVQELYRSSRMDLNKLTPEVKVFKGLSQSEIDKITKDGGILAIVFSYEGQEGIILCSSRYTDLYSKGREEEGIDLGNGYYRILGRPRNVVTLINKPGIEYTAWALEFPDGDVSDKVEKRAEQKKGAIFRTPEQLQNWMSNFDKSGYRIDKNKYKEMLQKIREEGGMWAKKMDNVMRAFLDLQNKIVSQKKMDEMRYDLRYAMEAISSAALKSLSSIYSDKEKNELFKKAESMIETLKKAMKDKGISA